MILAIGILANGGTIVYTPFARVVHHQWRQPRALRQTFVNYGIGAGAVAGKYWRCANVKKTALAYLLNWIVQQGIRQIGSGILKWRNWQKVEAGLIQLLAPFYGIWLSRLYKIDYQRLQFKQTPPQNAGKLLNLQPAPSKTTLP